MSRFKKNDIQLAHLVDTASPAAVFEEVKNHFICHYSIADFMDVRAVFGSFNALMDGKYPGYKACNTKYHDKTHTTDALLAISRLIDGHNIERKKFPVGKVRNALIATILHDSGYLQMVDDTKGTGAKYTLNHVERSIDFIEKYFRAKKFPKQDFVSAANMVRCTGLSVNLADIDFSDDNERILGYMLGTADLLGQMSSRTYLERLMYLYKEFEEGGIGGYDSEFSLMKKTLEFYADVQKRFEKDFGGVYRYALVHFRERYGIDKDMYAEAIRREMDYLRKILDEYQESYRSQLKRAL